MSSTLSRSTSVPVVPAAVPRELHQLLLDAGFRDRQLTALGARLGLSGEHPTTLAAAGRVSGYTRERVRQLEARLRGARRRLPATERALRTVEHLAPAPLASVTVALEGARLVRPAFPVASLLRAAQLLGLEQNAFILGTSVLREADREASDSALAHARRLVRRDGVGNAELLDPTERRLLRLRPEPVWLDRRLIWFAVRGTDGRTGLLLRKMLSSSRSLTIAEVTEGFRRAARPVVAPPGVVASLCETFPWLVVDRSTRTVTRKVALDPVRAHSPVERTILAVFAEHGPTLRFSEVVQYGTVLGLNSASVAVYLTHMPSVVRLQRGLYAMRGTR